MPRTHAAIARQQFLALLWGLGTAGLLACSGGPARCIPGQSVGCVGPDGCSGAQTCNDQGNAFATCVCSTTGADGGSLADAGDGSGRDGGNSDLTPTPIPELARWESQMLSHGQQHCAYYDTPGLPFDVFLEHGYYDGIRVFYQIADYTGDPAWNVCADKATLIYRDGYVIPNNGGVPGYRNFSTGLRLDFERTRNTTSKQAAILLSQNTGPARETTPLEWSVTPERSREVAYALISLIDAEALGEPRRARLAELVDLALRHVDQWFISQTYRASMSSDAPAARGQYYIQPFMVGLTAQALIRYHEHTGDSRVLPAVKTAMDWLWTHAWVAQDQAFWYDNWTPDPTQPFPAKAGAPNTSLLVAPAFAWLYRQTGDAIYRDRGDQIFSGGVTGAWLDGGKQYNQSYMWSFAYVRWRSGE